MNSWPGYCEYFIFLFVIFAGWHGALESKVADVNRELEHLVVT
jgi:hypothetical protein